MPMSIAKTSPDTVIKLVEELNTVGYGCIPNYIGGEELHRMQEFVSTAVKRADNEYVHFNGPDSVAGSGLDTLACSPEFQELIYDVYERGTHRPAPRESEFYQVLRCLSGESGKKNSLIFHYDSYVVTALLPIRIPTSGIAGDLLMYPNTRSIRKAYIVNAMDKLLLDNALTQRVLRYAAGTEKLGPVRIKMIPGNLYFFWGYRSIHTNEPCDPDKVRATALFHFANPHRMNN